ncbi:bifunctional nuclease family protein [Jiulongibacter sediminis]|uniref:BFN domain-containing protein n=1 Tax=Jiulongibacter sediminis TaxID=1605367 RepID=A0A0P7BR77_9BACT|nr:bifunctional nuclease family protein [Jiulongibacter sediminis]KPM49742.1 hypothetical protein AFM12_03945 [Jiulongibacter sediminis]TBX26778.1 hypothetical protein TK44_03950 [Jiulongibacter sediminis]
MQKIEVNVIALTESVSKPQHYVLILQEPKSKKRIPIIIGIHEAKSIAMFMEKLTPSRPQTHDLFISFFDKLQSKLKEVFIHTLDDQTYYSKVFFHDTYKALHEIDARPSDAIAIAIRCDCPIFISELILETTGYLIDEKGREKKGSYAEYSMRELEELLEKVILKEDYESAIRIREAIERRKKAQ